jgi:ribosomal protein L40E
MSDTTPNTTKICPTCGTRLNINAARCSVCGANLAPSKAVQTDKPVQASRIPDVTLSLPLLVGLVLLLLAVGAGGVYAYFQATAPKVQGAAALTKETATLTATVTSTITVTPTPTNEVTETPAPTWTLPAPIPYKVASGDSCGSIAFANRQRAVRIQLVCKHQ